MARIPPVKIDLFRFMTLRTPQLVDNDKRELGFVFHPEGLASHFLSAVTGDSVPAGRRQVQDAAAGFRPLQTYRMVRELDPDLYDFALYLGKNRAQLRSDATLARLSNLSPLSEEHLTTVWDNLFFQVVRRQAPTVRQACTHMLIANNFVRMATATDMLERAKEIMQTPRSPESPGNRERIERYFKRLAGASVVLPSWFSTEKKVGRFAATSRLLPSQKSLLSKLNSMARLKAVVSEHGTTRTALAFLVDTLDPTSDLSALIADADSEGVAVNPALRVLSSRGGQGSLSIASVAREIDAKIINTKAALYRAATSTTSRTQGDDLPPYSATASFDPGAGGDGRLFLTLKPASRGARVTKVSHSVKKGNSVLQKGRTFQELDTQDGLLNVAIPASPVLSAESESDVTLESQITLDTGETVQVAIPDVFGQPGHDVGIPDFGSTGSTDNDTPAEEVEHYGVNRLGIGVFRKVEQEVCCYVPGEVSRIENILAREYKERQTRNLLTTETTEEETSEIEVEEQQDTATTTRNEIASEIAMVLDEQRDAGVGASAGATGKVLGVEVSADGYIDYASGTASSSSDSEARTYAQEVVNSALERIVQKTTKKRTIRMLQEYEETNRHGFDNREGDEHVTGVYRWVDIVYTNRVVNYGKRLMFEFLIPEPARFYKEALTARAEAAAAEGANSDDLTAPTDPASLGINSFADIEGYGSPANYLNLASAYGVSVPAPPTEKRSVTQSWADADVKKTKEWSGNGIMAIPDGYEANLAKIDVWYRHDARNSEGTHWVVAVGGEQWSHNIQEGGNNDREYEETVELTLSGLTETVTVTFSGDRTLAYDISVTLECGPTSETLLAWQKDVYDTVVEAYEAQLAEYEAELAAQEQALEAAAAEAQDELLGNDEDTNRSIELRELQRVAIEMLLAPFEIDFGRDFYTPGSCNVPSVLQTEDWRIYSSHVKFFEQAFEWDSMAYIFYPYYWADRCSWVDLIQLDAGDDAQFQAFLQSGMARMVVPVRRRFERAVGYFLETGEIWSGGDLVLDRHDDLYLSIDEELAEIEGFVEEEWQTRVPTELTLVQGKSVYLEDEGLPCCEGIDEDTLLRPSTASLGESASETDDPDV